MASDSFCEVLYKGKWNNEWGICHLPKSMVKKIVSIGGVTVGREGMENALRHAFALVDREGHKSLSHIQITPRNVMEWTELYPRHSREDFTIAHAGTPGSLKITRLWRKRKVDNLNEEFFWNLVTAPLT